MAQYNNKKSKVVSGHFWRSTWPWWPNEYVAPPEDRPTIGMGLSQLRQGFPSQGRVLRPGIVHGDSHGHVLTFGPLLPFYLPLSRLPGPSRPSSPQLPSYPLRICFRNFETPETRPWFFLFLKNLEKRKGTEEGHFQSKLSLSSIEPNGFSEITPYKKVGDTNHWYRMRLPFWTGVTFQRDGKLYVTETKMKRKRKSDGLSPTFRV